MAQVGRGQLIVKPLQGKLTRDTEVFGRMDPYISVKLGHSVQKTQVHNDGGKHPYWNDTLVFERFQEHILEIEVWDKDTISADDQIGVASIALSSIFQKKKVVEWVTINHKGKSSGSILFDLEWIGDPTLDQNKNNVSNSQSQNQWQNTSSHNHQENPQYNPQHSQQNQAYPQSNLGQQNQQSFRYPQYNYPQQNQGNHQQNQGYPQQNQGYPQQNQGFSTSQQGYNNPQIQNPFDDLYHYDGNNNNPGTYNNNTSQNQYPQQYDQFQNYQQHLQGPYQNTNMQPNQYGNQQPQQGYQPQQNYQGYQNPQQGQGYGGQGYGGQSNQQYPPQNNY